MLGLTLALAAAPLLSRLGPAAGEGFGGLLAAFRRQDSARAVGARYLEVFPSERDPVALRSALLHDIGAGAGDGADPAEVRARLRERVRRDFECGDVVCLDGWVLARSECRACALVALAAAGAAG